MKRWAFAIPFAMAVLLIGVLVMRSWPVLWEKAIVRWEAPTPYPNRLGVGPKGSMVPVAYRGAHEIAGGIPVNRWTGHRLLGLPEQWWYVENGFLALEGHLSDSGVRSASPDAMDP